MPRAKTKQYRKPSETQIDLSEAEKLELHPDAWERFERAVDMVPKKAPLGKMPKMTRPRTKEKE